MIGIIFPTSFFLASIKAALKAALSYELIEQTRAPCDELTGVMSFNSRKLLSSLIFSNPLLHSLVNLQARQNDRLNQSGIMLHYRLGGGRMIGPTEEKNVDIKHTQQI